MKKLVLLLIVVSLFSTSCNRWKKESINNGNLRIESSESIFVYKFKASFPQERTVAIKNLLSTKLEEPEILQNRSINNSIRLKNQTSFTLKLKPGKLEIRIKKNNRSEVEIEDIRNLGNSIKQILLNP